MGKSRYLSSQPLPIATSAERTAQRGGGPRRAHKIILLSSLPPSVSTPLTARSMTVVCPSMYDTPNRTELLTQRKLQRYTNQVINSHRHLRGHNGEGDPLREFGGMHQTHSHAKGESNDPASAIDPITAYNPPWHPTNHSSDEPQHVGATNRTGTNTCGDHQPPCTKRQRWRLTPHSSNNQLASPSLTAAHPTASPTRAAYLLHPVAARRD